MICFIVLTLAHTLGVPGSAEPAIVNRAQIVTVRASLPPDPQRPSARSLIRISGPAVLYVTETPAEVVRAPCIER